MQHQGDYLHNKSLSLGREHARIAVLSLIKSKLALKDQEK